MTFATFEVLPSDPVLAIAGRVRSDTRRFKMDLGIGVYRDEDGNTPVLSAVKAAEHDLLHTQRTKAYLGPEGDPGFVALLRDAMIGRAPRLRGLQTVGGTGALRLAADLLKERRIWLGIPSWPNHVPLFSAAGLQVMPYDLFPDGASTAQPDTILTALADSRKGDVVLLHGCCHNPTGVDPEPALWTQIADLIVERGLVALVDTAYQGLGHGWSQDGALMRALVERVPDILIAYSCNKNFGLYRERVGALFVAGATPLQTDAVLSHLAALARASYSMPPDHGASIVRTILEQPDLTASWRLELESMRQRVVALRRALAYAGRKAGLDLDMLEQGTGMFSILPIDAAAVGRLAKDHAIYMPASGRINVAATHDDTIGTLVAAIVDVSTTAVA